MKKDTPDVQDALLAELEKRAREKHSFKGRMHSWREYRRDCHLRRKMALKEQLSKAGMTVRDERISRILLILCFVINILATIFLIRRFASDIADNYVFLLILLVTIWSLLFIVILAVTWLLFYLSLDLAIFQRKMKLEEVLPDFLQLTSSNIRAGMTIDQALWFAVRPRFGVLAKEIQDVAKRTFAGESLDQALERFVNNYDSKVLKRSINLLIEGLNAGGELGSLLNKISENIQETTLMKKEMAANVTSYVIFITFATIFAAPFLFGMAVQLIQVIQEVFSRVDINPGAASSFPITLSSGVISIHDFMIFAVVSLIITSFFSAIIVSVIKKGNVKSGVKYIPMFAISSVLLFFLVVKLFSSMLGGFF
ncbi:MAG: type II secretion system F family protein [Candidatus Woesearchaeota archaeon]